MATTSVPYNFFRSGNIPATYTDLLLVASPADGVLRQHLYLNQLNSFLNLGTVGGGVKLRVLVSNDYGVTWNTTFETTGGLLAPDKFPNKSSYVVLGCGSSIGSWFRVQVASLDASKLAANAVLNALAQYDV